VKDSPHMKNTQYHGSGKEGRNHQGGGKIICLLKDCQLSPFSLGGGKGLKTEEKRAQDRIKNKEVIDRPEKKGVRESYVYINRITWKKNRKVT